MEEKGLPKYSIKGGICNKQGCLKICTTLCNTDGIWYCQQHAVEEVGGFIKAVADLGGSVI